MFEHMKNYEKLMARIAEWVKPGGHLFVHIFVHKEAQFHFVDTGSAVGSRGITGPGFTARGD